MMPNLIKKIQNFAYLNDLWEGDSKIIVAVSGGPDSSCLLDVLYRISKKYPILLHVAHVNYGLRGADSDLDEDLAAKKAEKYGLDYSCFRAGKLKNPSEELLRNMRYDFFETLRRQLKYDLVAVGHNADDQAETVLFRIIRGTGLAGLSAMKSKNGAIIRPLLDSTREEILAYLKDNKIKYRLDRSNLSEQYSRNKIRNKLLPYLEKNYNPNIKKNLVNLADTVAEDYSFIQTLARLMIKFEQKEGKIEFNDDYFSSFDKSLKRQFIRESARRLNGGKELTMAAVEEILKVFKSTKNKAQTANVGGLKIERRSGKISMVGMSRK